MAKKNLTLKEKLEESIVKDGPYEVLGNWIWSKLEYISDNVTSSSKKLKQSEYKEFSEEFSIPIVDQGENFVGGYSDKLELIYDGKLPILVFGDHSRCIKYVDFNFIQGADGVKILLPKGMNIKYLYYMLKNLRLPDKGYSRHYKFLRDEPMPIAPLNEQQRIVDRIESLFEKLDKAKELIEKARDGFEKRKSAVLEKAFRGELTTEWRKNNTVKILGPDYLSYISKKREEIFSCLVKDSKRLGMKKPTKIHNADGEYEAIENCETWIRTKLCNVIYDFRYGTSSKSEYSFEGKPVIRIPNLSNGYITHDDMKYLKEDEVELNNKVNTGDILIVRSNGSPLLIGKTSIITELESDFAFASYLIRIRPIGIDSKFLYYMLNSISVKEQFYSKSKSTSGINNINTVELGNSIIVLPPLEEQKEIVKILDKLLEEESKIEELTQLEDQIELIKKSILAKAFRGELGTNSEEDESALELLKEILSKE